MFLIVTVLILLSCGSAPLLSDGGQDETAPPKPSWRFVLAGIEENRKKLRSGEFEVEGTFNSESKTQIPSGVERIYGAFDASLDRWRMDVERPAMVPDPNVPPRDDPKDPRRVIYTAWIQGRERLMFYRTRDNVGIWRANDGWYPTIEPTSRTDLDGSYLLFDPRAMGVYHLLGFRSGKRLPEVLAEWKTVEFDVDTTDPSVWKCTWNNEDDLMDNEWEFTVDAVHGFTITRFEQRERPKKKPEWPMRPRQVVEVRWEMGDGVWVPAWHRTTQYIDVQSTKKNVSEWNIHWKRVNQPLEDRIFSIDGFKPPPTVGILDKRSGRAVLVKEPDVATNELGHPPLVPSRLGRNIALTLINTALVGGFAIWLFLRRRRSADPK